MATEALKRAAGAERERAAWPWATVAVIGAAVALAVVPGAAPALVYDRPAVLAGQWWRLVTCHWVHFSASHLTWNVVVLALAGGWCERAHAMRTRWLYAVAPIVIGVTLLAFAPAVVRYGGLSGVGTGVVVLLALAEGALARRAPADRGQRWIWRVVLAAVALKIGAEAFHGGALFAHFADASIRAVPLAHLGGAAVAAVVHAAARERRAPRAPVA